MVARVRTDALLIMADRLKMFFGTVPGQCTAPPLRLLSDAETRAYLWTGPRSVVRRAVVVSSSSSSVVHIHVTSFVAAATPVAASV